MKIYPNKYLNIFIKGPTSQDVICIRSLKDLEKGE